MYLNYLCANLAYGLPELNKTYLLTVFCIFCDSVFCSLLISVCQSVSFPVLAAIGYISEVMFSLALVSLFVC